MKNNSTQPAECFVKAPYQPLIEIATSTGISAKAVARKGRKHIGNKHLGSNAEKTHDKISANSTNSVCARQSRCQSTPPGVDARPKRFGLCNRRASRCAAEPNSGSSGCGYSPKSCKPRVYGDHLLPDRSYPAGDQRS